MEIYTIGFTKKSAKDFFERLRTAGVRKLIDVRINNTSQLAGFARRDDLNYFLESILGIAYIHEPRLAPTQELLRSYRGKEIDWNEYQRRFLSLLSQRRVEQAFPQEFFESSVLLCSEATADRCHRRLIVDYLNEHWRDIRAVHL